MEKKMKKIILTLIATFGISFSISSQATILDFTSMGNQQISTIGDVTFSLAGIGEQGAPSVSTSYGGGLWNSTDGAIYPTNTILKAEFDNTATGILFDFDNEGSKSTFWSLFDVSNSLIATGALSTGSFDLSTYSGVKSIEWNNNGNNWLFAVESLAYDSTASIPEPSSIALLALGFAGIRFASKKKAI